jgi:predicted acyl esterase
VAGEPAVTFFAASVAPRVQLDVRLLDVAPDGSRALITRGTLTVDAGAVPMGMRQVRIATFGNLWPVAADHRLRLEVTNVDSPYLRPSLVPSATAITNVELSLPIRR